MKRKAIKENPLTTFRKLNKARMGRVMASYPDPPTIGPYDFINTFPVSGSVKGDMRMGERDNGRDFQTFSDGTSIPKWLDNKISRTVNRLDKRGYMTEGTRGAMIRDSAYEDRRTRQGKRATAKANRKNDSNIFDKIKSTRAANKLKRKTRRSNLGRGNGGGCVNGMCS